MSDWQSYKRIPIRIGHQCIALLHLFVNSGHLEDIWAWEREQDAEHAEGIDVYEQAAKQFGKQLEGHDCPAFWMAMKAEAERHISKWQADCAAK